MQFSDWEPIYSEILSDMGFDRGEDESSARLLKAVMMNADLVTEDAAADLMRDTAVVIGNAPRLDDELSKIPPGTVICSGSAVGKVMAAGITPDIVVTDLDGEIVPQIDASRAGVLTLMHAHGDNTDLIRRYAPEFKGPVILTTQSRPDSILSNYGGFTDGDRGVCLARHFGAERIYLIGFDFKDPSEKAGSDRALKIKKLGWAEKIISGVEDTGCEVLFVH